MAPLRHDVFFNRGVIGSQAYAREFGNRTPKADDPSSPEMVWLSRGLYEALTGFIALAKDGMGLRAACYEFHYQPVVDAFARAIEAGADVKIVYDAVSSFKTANNAAIANAGLDRLDAVIPRTVSEGIRHNKFIVLLEGTKPVAVWTGSTNISAGGIFGHSNVGHIVWDETIAQSYLDYWERLAQNLTPTKLRQLNRIASPTPPGRAPRGCVPLFSARDEIDTNATLQWYADRMAEANRVVCLMLAFNLDSVFAQVIAQENDVLRYIVKDDDLASNESIGSDHDVLFAAGGRLPPGALANFLTERTNPLNANRYIHGKFMLIDPIGNDPVVVTGSANFSRPSQRSNDENMLVIRGDKRVADLYFGEFMRVFDHHYARYLVRRLSNADSSNPDAGYLKETMEAWLPAHFDPHSPKSKRRRYFVGK
ncbi:MAG TPA: phospholipase D-like domain-containing protein [Burkholderiales bacterium]|nr:phospholipase D-like domain-containing protein [Burkholderiales bacterium]